MKKYIEALKKCALFEGVGDENITAMLDCLAAMVKSYKNGENIFSEGDSAGYLGIMLSGAARIVRVDYYGNRSIVAKLEPPQIFGESFACAGTGELPVDVVAAEDSAVLLIQARRITKSCSNACLFHSRMIFNLLNVVAKKNLIFHQKLEIISGRTTREKLMRYLLIQAKNSGSACFTVPYNRQELADYLEVDRSGLSSEIGRLRREGVLECKRSFFTLLKSEY